MNDDIKDETPEADEEQFEQIMEQAQESDERARTEGIINAELEKFVSYSDRIIYVEGDIEIFTPAFVRRRIEAIAKMTNDVTSPITLSISSYGGDVYAGLAICDLIKGAPMPINTIGYGPVMSAAGFILVSGTGTRKITQNSYVMIHDIFGMIKGRSSDVITETDHWKSLQNVCYKLFAEQTNKSTSFWKTKSKSTYYLTAADAKKFGIIDEVLTTWKITI
jgi:ATP-dependent Clp protease protease subunit